MTHGFSGLWGAPATRTSSSGTSRGRDPWSVQATPYRGFVVAVAWDTTGTYLLYMDPALKLRISKRQANGTYIQGRLLSTGLGPDAPSPRVTWWPPAGGGGRSGTARRPRRPGGRQVRPDQPVPGLHRRRDLRAQERITGNALGQRPPRPHPGHHLPGPAGLGAGRVDLAAAESDLRRPSATGRRLDLGHPGHRRVQQLLAGRADVGDDHLRHLEPGRPHGAGQQRHRPGSRSRPVTWWSAGPPRRRRSRRSWPARSAPPGAGRRRRPRPG